MKKIKDLIQDPSFANWALQLDERDTDYWEKWMHQHPERKEIALHGRALVRGIKFKKVAYRKEHIHQEWDRLLAQIDQETFYRNNSPRNKHFTPLRLVAVFAGIFMTISLVYFMWSYQPYHRFETAYGQKVSLTLPDGSEVTLHGNSSIRYPKHWDDKDQREVKLDGEAFFKVKKQKNESGEQRKFVVLTDDVKVEVIGTSFNVNTWKNSEVALLSGAVTLNIRGDQQHKLQLIPGQVAWVTDDELKQKTTDIYPYTAWTEGTLVFDETPISEIISLLKHAYGVQVKLQDPSIADMRLTGKLSVESADELLYLLELSFNLKVTRTENYTLLGK